MKKLMTLSIAILLTTACGQSFPLPAKNILKPLKTRLSTQTFSQANFPQQWLGEWSGECHSTARTGNTPQRFDMSLTIKTLEEDKRWEWTTVYKGDNLNQVRNYELQAINPSKGHYAIDEKNGIILDNFLLKSNTFVDQFSVGQSNISVKHKILENNTMEVSFAIFSIQPIRKSAAGNNKVNSFGLQNYQECTLKTQNNSR